MSTSQHLRHQLKRLRLSSASPLIAIAAMGCAFLVETHEVDYTYPVKLVLKGIIHDSTLLTIPTK